MTVGILHNTQKEQSLYSVERLREAILSCSAAYTGTAWCVLDEQSYAQEEIVARADLLISVGGDGTFLKTAKLAFERDVPVLGFNLGTLGLLTELEADNPEPSIRRLVSGDYIIEDRRVLHVRVTAADGTQKLCAYALNDCVLERGALSGVAYIALSIGGTLVDIYPCNGIVVATQTGSTAYSMSAGGPIVEPGNDVTVVTPVCAHFADGRPIVARAASTVELRLCKTHPDMTVSVDGHTNVAFREGDTAVCGPCARKLKILRIDPPNFYEALRQKAQERRRKLQHEI